MVAAVDGGEEVLRAALDPLHRPAGVDGGGRGDDLFAVDVELAAEAAADLGRDDAHLLLRHAHAACEQRFEQVRDLGRGPDGQGLRARPRSAPRRRAAPSGSGTSRWLTMRCLTTTSASGKARSAASASPTGMVAAMLVPKSWMHELGALFERLLRVSHAGQLLVVDLDEVGGVAGQIAVVGDDGGDRFALVADCVGGESPADRQLHALELRGDRNGLAGGLDLAAG